MHDYRRAHKGSVDQPASMSKSYIDAADSRIDKALKRVRGREPVNLAALRILLTNSSYCFSITITVRLKSLSRAIAEPEC